MKPEAAPEKPKSREDSDAPPSKSTAQQSLRKRFPIRATSQGDARKSAAAGENHRGGPDGNIVISSDDTQALDQLEELAAELAPPRKDYNIFRLKYAPGVRRWR